MSTRDGQVTAGIGADPTRVEDRRLVTGEARFTDDLPRPNARHVAFLRSPVAHARIRDIATARAEAREGVTAVITAADIEAADVATPGRIPIIPPPGIDPSERLHRSLIADDVVRYQGEIVAVVVAADRYAASDALGDIEVEYERLDAVVDPGSDGPTIHEDAPGNVAFEHAQGDEDRIETAFERASHVVEVEIGNQRLVQNPIEPRAAVVDYDPADGSLTYEGTTQIPHKLRRDLATILDHPERRIRVAAPDMGGGFGSRCVVNPEEPLLAWCAKYQIGRAHV